MGGFFLVPPFGGIHDEYVNVCRMAGHAADSLEIYSIDAAYRHSSFVTHHTRPHKPRPSSSAKTGIGLS